VHPFRRVTGASNPAGSAMMKKTPASGGPKAGVPILAIHLTGKTP
jgi:hypothetical protein